MAQSYARIKAKQDFDMFMDGLAWAIEVAVSKAELTVTIDSSYLVEDHEHRVVMHLTDQGYKVTPLVKDNGSRVLWVSWA